MAQCNWRWLTGDVRETEARLNTRISSCARLPHACAFQACFSIASYGAGHTCLQCIDAQGLRTGFLCVSTLKGIRSSFFKEETMYKLLQVIISNYWGIVGDIILIYGLDRLLPGNILKNFRGIMVLPILPVSRIFHRFPRKWVPSIRDATAFLLLLAVLKDVIFSRNNLFVSIGIFALYLVLIYRSKRVSAVRNFTYHVMIFCGMLIVSWLVYQILLLQLGQ